MIIRTVIILALAFITAFQVQAADMKYRVRKRICEMDDSCPSDSGGGTPPAGSHAAQFVPAYINIAGQGSVAFTLTFAEAGVTYAYSINDANPVTAAITGSLVASGADETVTGLNLGGLDDGTITLTASRMEGATPVSTATDTITKDTIAPQVTTLSPADNSASIPPGTPPALTFSENILAASGNIAINAVALIENIAVSGPQVAISGNLATLSPSSLLPTSTALHILVPAGAFTDLAGNPHVGLTSATDWNFTTSDGSEPDLSISVVSGTPGTMDIANGLSPGAAVILSIANTGDANSGALQILLTGTVTNFLKTDDDCTGANLVPADSCQITLHPIATEDGPYTATLTASDTRGESASQALAGTAAGFSISAPAWCWGSNSGVGALGGYEYVSSSVPVPVTNMGESVGISAMVSGYTHNCFIQNGGLKCWGYNSSGQLGNGESGVGTISSIPITPIGMDSGITDAAASNGNYTCAVKNGAAWCWGYNQGGQVGDGTSGGQLLRPFPAIVLGMNSGVTKVATSAWNGCAIKNGGVWCWGTIFEPVGTPALVPGLESGVIAINGGTYHHCAIKTNGSVWCWGVNTFGQLGNGTTTTSFTPVAVTGMDSGATAVAAGANSSCAIKNGRVWCWGYNEQGVLGNGLNTNSPVPVPVTTTNMSAPVSSISALGSHTCAIAGQKLWCWGYNNAGQLGNGTTTSSNVPVPVTGMNTGVALISMGAVHSCAVVRE